MRQVTTILKGIQSMRRFTIGEGTLRSLPPGAPMVPLLRSQPPGEGLSTLDYEGEVRANSDVTVGQFILNRVQVRVRLILARGLSINISHVAGFHDGLPCTTEPVYVTVKSPSTLASYPPCHGLFYGNHRLRESRPMILFRYLTTLLYLPSIFHLVHLVSICTL